MPRNNFRDEISQAITYVNSLPPLNELSESAVKQGIVLRVLSAAGWDTFDLSEVHPEYRSGTAKIDFALMSSSLPRSRSAATPAVFVEVNLSSENLESGRLERQMVNHCSRNNVPLGVLTNGLKWLLLSSPSGEENRESRFCEIDLAGNPDNAAEEINRYLARDRVVSGQAARSAERALQERNQNVVVRRAILDGWRQVVRGMDEGLIELVATASEQRAGERPENRFVRRVLMEHRSELLPFPEDGPAGSSIKGGSRRRPASFTFESTTQATSSWPDLLVEVCQLIRQRHPEDFDRILEIRGRTLPYFSRNEDEIHHPREIGDSGIYASCQGAGILIEGRARRVVELFGYPSGSLTIQTR